MPLSEEEQRILQQIEQQFYDSDPEFAHQVSASHLDRRAHRTLKLGVLGAVAGLALVVATLPVSVLLAFGGFLLMIASLAMVDHSARRLGRTGLRRLMERWGAARLLARFSESPRRRRDD